MANENTSVDAVSIPVTMTQAIIGKNWSKNSRTHKYSLK